MDYGILGSSDLDQCSKLAAKLQTNLLLPLIYPLIRDGQFKSCFLQKRLEKCSAEKGDYVRAFMAMFGAARPYVTMQSCKTNFIPTSSRPCRRELMFPVRRFIFSTR